jgi:hypothetical protein
MTKSSAICVALCVSLSAVGASGAGLGGTSPQPAGISGGAFGSSAAAPGTNSLGTALPLSRHGHRRTKGPPLGTGNRAVDREDATVAGIVHHSICRGC